MKGSVRKKGATWSYRIDLGVINGKRSQIERSGYKTKKEATAAMHEATITGFSASHVPIILSVHISLGTCFEPVCLVMPVTLQGVS